MSHYALVLYTYNERQYFPQNKTIESINRKRNAKVQDIFRFQPILKIKKKVPNLSTVTRMLSNFKVNTWDHLLPRFVLSVTTSVKIIASPMLGTCRMSEHLPEDTEIDNKFNIRHPFNRRVVTWATINTWFTHLSMLPLAWLNKENSPYP